MKYLKKSESLSLESKRAKYFLIGTCVALGITLASFEWRSTDYFVTISGQETDYDPIEIIDIPVTSVPDKPKPKTRTKKKQQGHVVAVEDFQEHVVDKSKDDDIKDPNDLGLEEIKDPEEADPIETKLRAIFSGCGFVTDVILPKFMCSENSEKDMLVWMGHNTKYPGKAIMMGIQGIVMVEFVIDEDGNMESVTALNDIGGGCTEEAVRVISAMPKWCPGMHHGKPVAIRFRIPCNFKIR